MARKRTISPSFWENEEVRSLTDTALRCAIGSWSVCDRNGVFEWRPRKWVFLFAPQSQEDPDQVFQQLIDARFVERFEAQDVAYGFWIKWAKHQDPHINEAPQFPMPKGNPRFTPCIPRSETKQNAPWRREVYGLTGPEEASVHSGDTVAAQCAHDASTSVSPSCPSRPSWPRRTKGPEAPL